MADPISQLLQATARRQAIATFGTHFRFGFYAAAAAYLVLLLIARLLALLPDFFNPWSLCAVPVSALLLAAGLMRSRPVASTAHALDRHAGTKDLFLTASMIGKTGGEYQQLVLTQAEEQAGKLKASDVVALPWSAQMPRMVGALAVLALAVVFLPQLDPLGQAKARTAQDQQKKDLVESRKATAVRAEALAAAKTEEKKSAEALARLEQTFKQAKPELKEQNTQKLNEHQKELGNLWREVSKKSPKQDMAMNQQSFGLKMAPEIQKARDMARQGDLSGLKSEMDSIKKALADAAKLPPEKRKEALEKTMKRMSELAQAMKEGATSDKVQEAIQRAMKQATMAAEEGKDGASSQEAMEAAMESLDLSQQEMEELQKQMSELKELEKALSAASKAKQLSQDGKLDGGDCGECKSMSDYEALYQKLCQGNGQGGEGDGPGMGGRGRGRGGKAEEDDSKLAGFKDEKDKTKVSAGKMLLEWKAPEVGPTGEKSAEYREAIQSVRQNASEAIVTEQIPVSYHEAVKRYFDALPDGQSPAAPQPK